MAAKKTDATPFEQKVGVLLKLFTFGIKNEKDLQSLTMRQALSIPDITVPELIRIMEVQEQTKAGKLFAYLGNSPDESAAEHKTQTNKDKPKTDFSA